MNAQDRAILQRNSKESAMTDKMTKDEAGRIARRRAKSELAKKHSDEYKALIRDTLDSLGFTEAPAVVETAAVEAAVAADKPARKPRAKK